MRRDVSQGDIVRAPTVALGKTKDTNDIVTIVTIHYTFGFFRMFWTSIFALI